MTYTTLISTDELALHIDDPDFVIVDCRFSLAGPESGRHEYLQGHIPGAVYADLDKDLSSAPEPGRTGRHPLPSVVTAAQVFSRLGIGPGTQVVAYDNAGGALSAGRLWWLLGWLGHQSAAVLDGGWAAWQKQGRPVRAGLETRAPLEFTPQVQPGWTVSVEEMDVLRQDPSYRVIDVRAAERFAGLNEPIDPIAGHIPGAVNYPYSNHLTADGTFKPAQALRADYQAVLGDVPAERVIFYCGSGVTAVHGFLALKQAGMGQARIYPGSWSEWITDPRRPLATGPA